MNQRTLITSLGRRSPLQKWLAKTMSAKDHLTQTLTQLGSQTGEFTVSKGDDTDLVIEHKIEDAEYYKLVGKQKILKNYRAYVLFDEATKEARYNEELTDESSGMEMNLA